MYYTGITATDTRGVVPGALWTSRSAPSDRQWSSVTYGKGLFVAVSNSDSSGNVMTSPDGVVWTKRDAPTGNWNKVTFGNGLFVAVGSGPTNYIMTSPDGINWTARTSSSIGVHVDVIYANNIFVCIVRGTLVNSGSLVSTDGITWAAGGRTFIQCTSIAYGNGVFVSVANAGTNRVSTSTDGITWTATSAPSNLSWTSVTYGNGLFVAVSLTANGFGQSIMTSPDGINWTMRDHPVANNWTSVVYGNSQFVVVGSDGTGDRVMTSPDGITWTDQASAEDNYWIDVTYSQPLNRFVAVSIDGTNRVMTSL